MGVPGKLNLIFNYKSGDLSRLNRKGEGNYVFFDVIIRRMRFKSSTE